MSIKTAMCLSAKLELLQGIHQAGHEYKIALFTNAATLDANTTAYNSANEAVGTGYTAGGLVLTGYSAQLLTSTPVAVAIARSGGVATVTLEDHGFFTGQSVIIAGATQAEYNGTQQVTVVDSDTFTFPVAGEPATPATGSPVASFKAAVLSWDNAVWPAATLTARGALIYNNTLGGKNALAAFEFTVDGTPGNVSSTNGNFAITIPAATAETALIGVR